MFCVQRWPSEPWLTPWELAGGRLEVNSRRPLGSAPNKAQVSWLAVLEACCPGPRARAASQGMRPGCAARLDPELEGVGGWLQRGKIALFSNIPHNSGEKMQAGTGSKESR